MRQHFASIALLIAGTAIIAAGCVAPEGPQSGGFRMPGVPATPGMPGVPSTPLAEALPATPIAPQSQPIAPQSQPIAPQSQPIAQVGFFSSNDHAACGCQSCGPAACGPTPHGYVVQSPQGWNAHGIDPQEFVCDGGDQPPRAVLNRNDVVLGLQGEDTVVHYTTESGDIQIQASNRTCLYAPRFSSVRKITGAVAGGRAIGAAQFDRPMGANRIEHELPGLVLTDTTELGHADVARRLDAMRERIRGVPVDNVLQLEQTGDVMAALVGLSLQELSELQDEEKALYQELAMAAVAWSLDESLEVVVEDLKVPTLTRDEHLRGLTVYDFPEHRGRLEVTKLADRGDALPGEVVTFTISVTNAGDSVVNEVVLIDNLTTRLEYVDGSQTCSAEAEFSTTLNNSESLKLQWKLSQPLPVGESVEIRFECKVR